MQVWAAIWRDTGSDQSEIVDIAVDEKTAIKQADGYHMLRNNIVIEPWEVTGAEEAFTVEELRETEKKHWIWTDTKYCYCSLINGSQYVEYSPDHLIDVMRRNREKKEQK